MNKIYLALGVLVLIGLGWLGRDFLAPEPATLAQVEECEAYYEKTSERYWHENEVGRLDIIYNPKLKACLVANFHNKHALDDYIDTDNYLEFTEEEWIARKNFETETFGLVINMNTGKVLTSYISDFKGMHTRANECQFSHESIETEGLFGTKEVEGCDGKKDLMTKWGKETVRYGFSAWN